MWTRQMYAVMFIGCAALTGCDMQKVQEGSGAMENARFNAAELKGVITDFHSGGGRCFMSLTPIIYQQHPYQIAGAINELCDGCGGTNLLAHGERRFFSNIERGDSIIKPAWGDTITIVTPEGHRHYFLSPKY